jgi:Protein of unknown function (DUF3300)
MRVSYGSTMTTRVVALFTVLAVWFAACGSPRDQSAPQTQAGRPPSGTLDQLLAPIALYPDPLLAQMLMSATTPAKITELDGWLKKNQKLKGTPLQDAAVKAGFDPSFVALALFPQVVAKMAGQIAWTTLLGQAFATDRNSVLDAIQRLRHQAQNVGTLKSTPQQEVATKTTPEGQDVIVIQPANPQVVYVPQYNTEVIYTQAPSTNTTVIIEDNSNADAAVAAGVIGFTAGIAIGAAMNNNYYYGPYGWHGSPYMYNNAWDDYYDHREDAREDWMDHREDLVEERSDRLENTQEQRSERLENSQEQRSDRLESTQGQRTDRQQTRQENRPESQAQRTERGAQAKSASAQGAGAQRAAQQSAPAQRVTQQGTSAPAQRSGRTGSTEARGYGDASGSQAVGQRSGGSDAFSGYSSGASQRSSSSRGQSSRSSARGGGGGRRR